MSEPNNSKQGSGSSITRVLAGGMVGFILCAFVMYAVGWSQFEAKPTKSNESAPVSDTKVQ